MTTEEIEEKAAYYLNELREDRMLDILHDEDAYSLYKTILERVTRSIQAIYEKSANSSRSPLKDFYYEGYDSKGNPQKASTWWPLELLNCKNLFEAYLITCATWEEDEDLSTRETRVLERLKFYSKLGKVDGVRKFFLTLNKEVGGSTLFAKVWGQLTDNSEAFFLKLLKSEIEGIDFRNKFLDAIEEKFAFKIPYCLHTYNRVGFYLDPPAFSVGSLSGVDLNDPSSVGDFLSGLDLRIVTGPEKFQSGLLGSTLPKKIVFSFRSVSHQVKITAKIRSISTFVIRVRPDFNTTPYFSIGITNLAPYDFIPELFKSKRF